MKKLTIMKFGGSLITAESLGANIVPLKVKEARRTDDAGPIVVLSAPQGYTHRLIEIGENRVKNNNANPDPLFESYIAVAKNYVAANYRKEISAELENYHSEVKETLDRLGKRFEGTSKARILTSGGELPTSALMDFILRSRGLNSLHLVKDKWPIITDDDYENATPNLEKSLPRAEYLIEMLEKGKIIVHAGFLGSTDDGLETVLGRGGSDITAVFDACLLKDRYRIQLALFKETPVLSADPKIVEGQNLQGIKSMTYNEAIKASTAGMKIVQSSALRLARMYRLPVNVVPIDDLEMSTVIKGEDTTGEILKCVTGKKNCIILTLDNDKSLPLENTLRLWEGYEDFIDLGTETLETGKTVRDLLLLDGDFAVKHKDRLKKFNSDLEVEHGVGVVTLIGDRMKSSPGVASIAISALPDVNIKRAVFAPHTSQIILVLDNKDVENAIRAIHSKREEINR